MWAQIAYDLLPDVVPVDTVLTALDLMRAAGLDPDPWQQNVVATAGDQLLLCHRQSGKSTVAAAIAHADACATPDTLVLLVSPSLRQSGELFRKVKTFYQHTRPLPLLRDTELSLEFSNRSRIISLPGTEETIVGYSSVRRLILDEAARIPDSVYHAVRPMLAMSGGSLLCLSTPWGQRGFFYEAWSRSDDDAAMDKATVEELLRDLGITVPDECDLPGEKCASGWTKTFLPAPANPRLSRWFLARERLEIPDLLFRQEWLGEFVETGSAVFRQADIDRMFSSDVRPLFGVHDPYAEALHGTIDPLLLEGNGWR